MTAATVQPHLDAGTLDAATSAVLAERYGYTNAQLVPLKHLGYRSWTRARHDVEAAAAVLTGSAVPLTVITEFQGEHRFLSNFWPLEDDLNDTAEHRYQGAKTLVVEERQAIAACPTPGHAKMLSSELTLRPDWDEVKLDVMREALEDKFSRPAHRDALLATGSAVLVEGNHWCDTFWGVCYCMEHDGEGLNWLGLLLMQKRNELRAATLNNTQTPEGELAL